MKASTGSLGRLGTISALVMFAFCGMALQAQSVEDSKVEDSKVEDSKVEDSKVKDSKVEDSRLIASKDDPSIPAPVVTTASPAEMLPAETQAAATPSSLATEARPSGSQVRIVRLSEVKGEVQLDRNIARGFEAAFSNLPIVQGARLRTGEGVAEVEFEDSSTLRLTPNTVIEFPRLGRNPSGTTATCVNVLKGFVYASLGNSKSNQFTMTFAKTTITLPPSSHIQLFVGDPTSRLGVYEGSVQVEGPSGTTIVGKKKALLFDAASQAPPTMVASLDKSPYDVWDKDAVDYHKRFANSFANGGTSPVFGLSDLSYYGGFTNIAGCGQVWRPYFASAAWDPFANGTWAWYQNSGYSFVSPYPWGWAPYHSGNWQQCSTGAWGWQPGAAWTGLANVTYLKPPAHGPARPHLPAPPRPGQSTIVAVNEKPLVYSKLSGSNTFVFNKDSAGLGVPRQPSGSLKEASNIVARQGAASAPIYTPQAGVSRAASMAASGQPSHSFSPSGSPFSTSRSSAPSAGMSSSSMSSAGMGSSTAISAAGPSAPAGGHH